MAQQLKQAYRFMFDNAGYATPPGRAVCAAQLARAEAEAKQAGVTYQWDADVDCDVSWMSEAERKQDHVCEYVIARLNGQVIGSLGGIVDATDEYRRVIEAELAAEAIDAIMSYSI